MFIQTIKECSQCGLKDGDFDEGHLRGFNDVCVYCGALDNNWNVQCTCGNDRLWSKDYEVLAIECPKCGVHSHDFEVTAIDSAYIINNVLKRPDLHRTRVFVPVSFVETILDYLRADNRKNLKVTTHEDGIKKIERHIQECDTRISQKQEMWREAQNNGDWINSDSIGKTLNDEIRFKGGLETALKHLGNDE